MAPYQGKKINSEKINDKVKSTKKDLKGVEAVYAELEKQNYK